MDVIPAQLSLAHCGNLQFFVRDGTSDIKAVQEVVEKRAYFRRDFSVCPGEHWLDLGANIGAFTCLAASMGATVTGYEADPRNSTIAEMNIAQNNLTATIISKAVVGDCFAGDNARLFLSNTAYGQWRHSLYQGKKKHYIDVPIARFSELLPGVDGVKMDIEGAEVEIIDALDNFAGVRKLCLEYHLDVYPAVDTYNQIVNKLSGLFDQVRAYRMPDGLKQYTYYPPAKIIHCWNLEPRLVE